MSASTLQESFDIQRRVIGALLLREVITRYGRHNIGVLWLVVEPMLFTLGIAAAWYFAKLHVVSNIPIIAFAITGYSSVLIWRNTANRCLNAIQVNMGLLYHKNVKVIDIFVARILLELIGGTASFALLSFFFAATGVIDWPQDLATVLVGWLLLCWFAAGIAMVAGTLASQSESFDRVWHIATYLFFPISGAVFMVQWLPAQAQKVVLWLPMVHGVEMVRHGYFGNVVRTHEAPLYLIFFNMLLTLLGVALVRAAEGKVQPE